MATLKNMSQLTAGKCYIIRKTHSDFNNIVNHDLGKLTEAPVMRGSGDGKELTAIFEHMPLISEGHYKGTPYVYIGEGLSWDYKPLNLFEEYECPTKGGKRVRRSLKRRVRRTRKARKARK
jgi:hypothetical protein